MLSRIVRTQFRTLLRTPSASFSQNIILPPEKQAQIQKFIEEVEKLPEKEQEEIATYVAVAHNDNIERFAETLLNFSQPVNGKTLILRSYRESRNFYSVGDVTTAFLAAAGAIGLGWNFNYLVGLASFGGVAACFYTTNVVDRVRMARVIQAIEIDDQERLHILTITRDRKWETIITEKKNFHYNVVGKHISGTEAIWCRLNGEDFWISQKNLDVNNNLMHHLL